LATIRFINKDSATGGDGTTNSTGAESTRAYNNLNEAEGAEDGDLSTLAGIEFRCEGNSTDDTATVFFDAATWTNESATDFIQVLCTGTGIHTGARNTGYVLTSSSGHAIETEISFTRIGNLTGGGLTIQSTSTTGSNEGIRIDCSQNTMADIRVEGNFIHSTTTTDDKDGVYCNPGSTNDLTANIRANVITGWGRCGIHAQNHTSSGTFIVNCENNTFHGNTGFSSGGDTWDIGAVEKAANETTLNCFNNICASAKGMGESITAASNPLFTGTNNITLDGTHANPGNGADGTMTGGAQATDGVVFGTTKTTGAWIVFTSSSGVGDYSLFDEADGNKPVNFGVFRTSTVPTDILGNAYDGTNPDSGAFEFQTAVAPTDFINVQAQRNVRHSGRYH